jgi:nitrile hydratase subunit beta
MGYAGLDDRHRITTAALMSYVSHADLGGTEEHRRITLEPEGDLFHAPWEPRVLALVLGMGATGMWNLDMNRSARETLPNYLDLSYYEIWLAGLEKILRSSGALNDPAPTPVRVLHADAVAATLARGSPCSRPETRPARFSIGRPVRTRSEQPAHHTRLPAYARGKRGVIERVHGMHVFADTNAQGLGESPQWLYTVAFEENEIWSEPGPRQGTIISIDAWEPYLEPV